MNRELKKKVTDMGKNHRRKRVWRNVVVCLACVVVFCTVYALVLPAITMEGKLYCQMENHTHTDECYELSENLICDIDDPDHIHVEECYEKVLICGKQEHTHDESCYVNPDESSEVGQGKTERAAFLSETIPAGSGYYHSKNYLEYEQSRYLIKKNGADAHVCTFILVPKTASSYEWTPDTNEWNAHGNFNYDVTYCVDPFHTIAESGGVDYIREPLKNIKDFDEPAKNTLERIVQNSYPFITEEEMRNRLNTAGIPGEFGKSEMTAATQAAIWEQSTPCTINGKDNAPRGLALNGILPDNNNVAAVQAIKDWLINDSQKDSASDILEIADANRTVKNNGDETFDVTVEVVLNRAVTDEDDVEAVLVSITDESKTTSVKIESGKKTFTITLKGVSDTGVKLKITGTQKNAGQVYFYRGPSNNNNSHYQHMIGMRKGITDVDIEREFYSEETFVSVKKVWEGDANLPDSITVYLYIDGKKSDKYLVLSKENNWQGRWDGLSSDHKYTVEEIAVPGFTVTVDSDKVSESSGQWVKADGFEAGNLYLLETSGKLFSVNNTGNLDCIPVGDILSASDIDPNADYIWSAKFDLAHDGYRLTNSGRDLALASKDQVKALLPSEDEFHGGRAVKYKNSKLFIDKYEGFLAYQSSYFAGLPKNGIVSVASRVPSATPPNNALDFDIYTWQENKGTDGTEFVITNTPRVNQKTSVSVTKKWVGDTEASRPQEITVTLLANGEEYSTVTLKAENNWSYTWVDLPAEDENFENIVYTVKEKDLDGYISTVEQTGENEFVITNRKAETASVSVEKKWEGLTEGAAVPLNVQVYLLANGERHGDNVELNESNSWRYRWQGLPKYDSDGKVIEYTVSEVSVEGFKTDIKLVTSTNDNNDFEKHFVITNTMVVYELPETGGIGTILYTFSGIALMMGAALLYYKRGKRKIWGE